MEKTKVVNLSKALKEAVFADEEEKETKNDEAMESLGSYILLTTLISLSSGLLFWIIVFHILQMDSRKYVNSTVEKNKNIIMILVLIATACAGFISCVNDKTISFLIILMFTVCVIGILSLLLITQVLKRYLAVTAK